MDALLQDLRYALRTLRRAPNFTAVAVLTLALGIGATTTVFSVVYAVLLRPLPYERPEQLVAVWETARRETLERRPASYPNFDDWRRSSRSFAQMAAFSTEGLTVSDRETAERASAEIVSASYFDLLGVRPVLGRALKADDDVTGRGPVVVISHGFWQRRFGGAPSAVGRSVVLEGQPTLIVGVMPEWFRGVSDAAELWVPFTNVPGARDQQAILERRGSRWHQVIARLRPNVTVQSAQSELAAIARQLEAQYPEENRDRGVEVVPLPEDLFGGLRRGLFVLLGAVGFVLLIACANTANLQLVRAAGRERELAVRTALGASRSRTIRQMLVESVVVAVVGGMLGVLLAVWGVELLTRLNPIALPSFAEPRVDGHALAATLLIALATGLAFGLAPALAVSEPKLSESLKAAGSRGASAGRGAGRLRGAFVVTQLALAVVLLAGAGLMLRSLERLRRFDPGFRADGVLVMRLAIPKQMYDASRAVELGRQLVERLNALPGIRGAGLASDTPLDGTSSATTVEIEGRAETAEQGIRIYRHRIGPGYLAALGAPLVRGRDITAHDAESGGRSGVALISESMARRYWPTANPIGARLRYGDTTELEIVGVVGDVKHRTLLEAATADPDVYLPLAQFPTTGLALLARTAGDPAAMAAAVRREVRALDRDVPVFAVATLRERVREQTAPTRFQSSLLGGFSALALVLAAIGVYGVMAYGVTQRTRELGIRVALGASRADVLRLVVGQGARVAVLGVAVGVTAALAATRVLASLLVGVSATDPLTFALVAALLGGVVLLASYLPARRAARVDPTVTLRDE